MITSIKLSMWGNTKHSNIVISLCVLIWFFAGKPCFSNGGDTLSKGEYLTATQTLISKDGIFELGFFKTGTDSSQGNYLGIWYKDFPEKNIVWVANRDKPLANTGLYKFKIVPNGNLGLYLGRDSFWSTNLMSSLPESIEAVLLDNGNLILRDGSKPATIFWQSFDHPTHVWLPEAPLRLGGITGKAQSLVSWKDEDDPSHGLFSVEISQDESFQFMLKWNMSDVYWKSGAWNGYMFASVPEISYFINFSLVSNENETYCSYSVLNLNVFSMFVMNPLGNFELLTSLRSHHYWTSVHVMPKEERDMFGICGPFGVLNGNTCSCLQGFDPVSRRLKDGCIRKANLHCENLGSAKGKKDGFLEISESKLPAKPIAYSAHSDKSCMLACLENCSCSAYAFTQSRCSIWEGDLYNSQHSSNNQENHYLLYLKLANSELQNGKSKTLGVIMAVVVPVVVLVFGGALSCFYTRRTKQKEKKASGKDLLSFDFNLSVNKPSDDGKRNNTDFDLPMFNYASVSAATTNFAPENKLGEGGFGPVYKGKLLNGQEVALKRLSKKSGQGFEEFRNEILVIAKLQHRNLVRLLGCCVDTDESILIYEYMPNKSLDFFLFDSSKQMALDWKTRTYIVEGIAQGLLYLHEHSRVRIVHRDLKASNILLDDEMYPKISDFGMARIFGGNDSRAQTNKIVGTFGYMAPEYALEGLFSVKSDVFSFGVLVLEIISGKKNTGFYHTDSLNLLGYAWELWISNRGLDLVDQNIATPPSSRVLRYINVGLLCVQKFPNDRPNMSTVVSMLSSEIAALPPPKQPAFSSTTSISQSLLPNNCEGKYSVNGLTVSTIEPR